MCRRQGKKTWQKKKKGGGGSAQFETVRILQGRSDLGCPKHKAVNKPHPKYTESRSATIKINSSHPRRSNRPLYCKWLLIIRSPSIIFRRNEKKKKKRSDNRFEQTSVIVPKLGSIQNALGWRKIDTKRRHNESLLTMSSLHHHKPF